MSDPLPENVSLTPNHTPETPMNAYQFSPALTHENLTLFLVSAREEFPDAGFLTLQEALQAGKAVVHETQNINELAIENTDANVDIFVQAGDLVKGGYQDRTFGVDVILPAKSGRVPVISFCVESGRWHRRGHGPAHQFESSCDTLSSKEILFAAKSPSLRRRKTSQSQVWNSVHHDLKATSESLHEPIACKVSPTSLQLGLENKTLRARAEEYRTPLGDALRRHPDALGVAVFVNGRLSKADLYGNAALFRKLWDKLLNAAIFEAIRDLPGGMCAEAPLAGSVKGLLEELAKVAPQEEKPNARTRVLAHETPRGSLFDTLDTARGEACLHRNLLAA